MLENNAARNAEVGHTARGRHASYNARQTQSWPPTHWAGALHSHTHIQAVYRLHKTHIPITPPLLPIPAWLSGCQLRCGHKARSMEMQRQVLRMRRQQIGRDIDKGGSHEPRIRNKRIPAPIRNRHPSDRLYAVFLLSMRPHTYTFTFLHTYTHEHTHIFTHIYTRMTCAHSRLRKAPAHTVDLYVAW
jgi:hypothetical protein